MNGTSDTPDWTRTAHRIDRPKIDRWWRPEDGALDGFLIWQGDGPDRQTGETYHAFAVREGATGLVLGVAERAALRGLRQARPGTRIFIKPTGKRDIGGGREMLAFEAYAQELVAPASTPLKNGRANDGSKDVARTPDDAADGASAPGSSDDVPF